MTKALENERYRLGVLGQYSQAAMMQHEIAMSQFGMMNPMYPMYPTPPPISAIPSEVPRRFPYKFA